MRELQEMGSRPQGLGLALRRPGHGAGEREKTRVTRWHGTGLGQKDREAGSLVGLDWKSLCCPPYGMGQPRSASAWRMPEELQNDVVPPKTTRGC